VTVDRVKGSVALDFEGSQAFDASFDATICPVTVDLCERLMVGCMMSGYTCVH
jgi:hypothetical protein